MLSDRIATKKALIQALQEQLRFEKNELKRLISKKSQLETFFALQGMLLDDPDRRDNLTGLLYGQTAIASFEVQWESANEGVTIDRRGKLQCFRCSNWASMFPEFTFIASDGTATSSIGSLRDAATLDNPFALALWRSLPAHFLDIVKSHGYVLSPCKSGNLFRTYTVWKDGQRLGELNQQAASDLFTHNRQFNFVQTQGFISPIDCLDDLYIALQSELQRQAS